MNLKINCLGSEGSLLKAASQTVSQLYWLLSGGDLAVCPCPQDSGRD